MMAWGLVTHALLLRLVRDSAPKHCATMPAYPLCGAHRASQKLRVALIQGPLQCPIWLTYSLACKRHGCCHSRAFLGDTVLGLVHKFDDFAQYWIQQLLGAPAFASLVIWTGFGGIENMLRVSLPRPVSLCTLLHTMPYLSTLATIRRST